MVSVWQVENFWVGWVGLGGLGWLGKYYGIRYTVYGLGSDWHLKLFEKFP